MMVKSTLWGRWSIMALALTCTAAMLHPSVANAASDAEEDNSIASPDEIMVTASKQERSIQKTPIAISVYSAEDLARNGITNIADLTRISPDVSFSQFQNQSFVTIRGISSRSTSEIGDPAVAVGIDGFFVNRSTGLNVGFFDVERVEVARGPQGTLYGRNATGGLIDVITAKPGKEFGGYMNAELGNYNTVKVDGAVNVPLSDTLSTRFAFASFNHDGYRNNAPTKDGDDQRTTAARFSLAWNPVPELRAVVQAEYSHQGGVGQQIFFTPFVYPTGSLVPSHERPALIEDKSFPVYRSPSLDSTSKMVRGNLEYDLPFATLTYVGGYESSSFNRETVRLTTPTSQLSFVQMMDAETQSHELRLSAKPGGPLFWQVGGYFFKEVTDLDSYNAGVAPTGERIALLGYLYHVKTTSKAVFGQVQYKLGDTLTFSGGVRYTDDYKLRTGFTRQPVNTSIAPVQYNLTPVTGLNSASFDKVTWHAGLDWQVTPANILYAKFDTGFKSGGFSQLNPYGPETVTAYEIGSKNSFADGQVTLNLSGFYYDYKGLQVGQFAPNPANPAFYASLTLNAPTTKIYGADADLNVKLGDHDRLGLSAVWMHSAFGNLVAATVSSDPILANRNVSLKGNHMPQTPAFTVTGRYQHDWTLANGGTISAEGQAKFQTAQYLTIFNYNNDRQDAYATVDLSLTYSDPSKRFDVGAFVRNLSDARVFVLAGENGFNQAYQYAFSAPRTWGVRGRFKY